MKTELTAMGTYGKQILDAWKAKELLRDLLRLTPKHAHLLPDRSAISAARYRFQVFCADRPYLFELVTLAETVDQWWDGIENYIKTGTMNAASEGNNRVIKLEARKAYGFRNRKSQRLRSLGNYPPNTGKTDTPSSSMTRETGRRTARKGRSPSGGRRVAHPRGDSVSRRARSSFSSTTP
jgi:hypothetical protein